MACGHVTQLNNIEEKIAKLDQLIKEGSNDVLNIYEDAMRATLLLLKGNTFSRFTRSSDFVAAVSNMSGKEIEKQFKAIHRSKLEHMKIRREDLENQKMEPRDFQMLLDMTKDFYKVRTLVSLKLFFGE